MCCKSFPTSHLECNKLCCLLALWLLLVSDCMVSEKSIPHFSHRPDGCARQGLQPSLCAILTGEKTCFPYFRLYYLQAAIDSFAVLSLSKIYHSRTLKSCWLGCIFYTSSLTKYCYKSLKWLLLHVFTKCWDQPRSKRKCSEFTVSLTYDDPSKKSCQEILAYKNLASTLPCLLMKLAALHGCVAQLCCKTSWCRTNWR